jgi:thiamine-phosphate pyrophosphorylase
MNYQFTPAAERVLNHAAGWIDRPDSCAIDARALFFGLLTETECRAAHLLSQHGVETQEVCKAWAISCVSPPPSQSQTAFPFHFNGELNHALRTVYQFALEFEQLPIFATEHLLLALLHSDSETTKWLGERGISRECIETDIRTRNGYVEAPIDIELDLDIGDDGENSADGVCRKDSSLNHGPMPTDGCPSSHKGNDGTEYRVLSTQSNASPTNNLPPSAFPLPPSSSPLLRLLDAAANRAREGFRVIEDYLRFVLDDRFLTETTKNLRHDLVAEMKKITPADLLASRETQADVGTGLTAAAEAVRGDLGDVLAANFGRLQESLRSLEEYGKLVDSAMAAQFKQIRYRTYTLQRAVEITRQSTERLAAAKLYVLIDGRNSPEEFHQFASSLIASGVHILQLRDKTLEDRQLLGRARLLRELTRGTPTLFIMNDRPDLAALSQADGVHLGQEELSVKDARTILGPQPHVGVSTHSIEQARQAVLDGASYLGVGPTFPSTTKDFTAFTGLDLLRQVAAEIRLPVFAIGGITLENLPEVLSTGISRVAVSGAISNAENPPLMAKDILEKIQ